MNINKEQKDWNTIKHKLSFLEIAIKRKPNKNHENKIKFNISVYDVHVIKFLLLFICFILFPIVNETSKSIYAVVSIWIEFCG